MLPPLLSCARYRKRYSAFRDGTLPPREAAEMQGHHEQCDTCRRRHHALEFGVRLLRASAVPVHADRRSASVELLLRR